MRSTFVVLAFSGLFLAGCTLSPQFKTPEELEGESNGGANTGATAQACSLNGMSIASGTAVTVYQSAVVATGQFCVSEDRECKNGVLSGSFVNASCMVMTSSTPPATPASCMINGASVQSGQSVKAYQSATVPFGQTCVSETRVCTNGLASGSFTNASCSVAAAASCVINGVTVQNGQSVTAFQASSVPSGQTCVSQVRMCNNGVASGSFTNVSCTVASTPTSPSGPAGCGLASAAFCDNFNQGPAAVIGRAGDLDATKWSAARIAPSDMNGGGGSVANPVRIAPIPSCRSSLGMTQGAAPYDTLICDPAANGNRQLMTVTSIQFYGNNSYMIQQPFDFANRTGKLVFDVDANPDTLNGFVSIDITEDPMQAPQFQEFQNFEPGAVPRNGISLKMGDNCQQEGRIKMTNTLVYKDYVGTIITNPQFSIDAGNCPKIQTGKLNHYEIQLSQTRVDVYASDFSADGVTFSNTRLIYTANLSLNFSRGYVHLSARNHASLKYGHFPTAVFHWDNVAFDGPVFANNKFYSVPDNTTTGTYYENAAIVNLGYVLRDSSNGVAGMYDPLKLLKAPLQVKGVDKTGMTQAKLSLYAAFGPLTVLPGVGLQYRLNGGVWRSYVLNALEFKMVSSEVGNPGGQGQIGLVIDVPFADVQNGNNTLEFLPINGNMGYPPVIANIDLILSK